MESRFRPARVLSCAELERAGTLALPPREGDPFVFGAPLGDDLAADAYDTHILDLGPHLET